MFDSRGAVLLTPPGWDEPDPADLGDWEPIPAEVWSELNDLIPFWADSGDIPLNDCPVREAVELPLGPHTLRLLTETPVSEMSANAKAWALRRAGELINHIEALRAELTASIAGPKSDDPTEDWGSYEVAVAAKKSVYAADHDVAFARALAGRLVATRQALNEGRITERQARLLSEETGHLTDDRALQVEQRMLTYSHRQDLPKFKASLKRWLARLDPDFNARARKAREEVTIEHGDLGDGRGEFLVRGPLEYTSVLDTALGAYAAHTKSDQGGTVAARKLAGLVEWAEAYLTSPDTPRRHGRAYGVNLVLDTPTMFGLADHPAEIPGYGMVPAQAALHLLADGSPIRRLIIDPDDGHLLHYGTKTYLVPPPLADHLIALHETSVGPHSAVPAAGCDMDHNLPHDSGGATDPDNNSPLDRRWHRAKTHAGWTYLKNNEGTVDWTSPSGLTERVHPHDYRLGP